MKVLDINDEPIKATGEAKGAAPPPAPSNESPPAGDGEGAELDAVPGPGGSAAPRPKRRRGRRGGKRHRKKPAGGAAAGNGGDAGGAGPPGGAGAEPAAEPATVEAADATATPGDTPALRRTRAPQQRSPRPRSAPRPRTPRPAAQAAGGAPAAPPGGAQALAGEPEAPALTAEAALAEDRADALSQMEGVEPTGDGTPPGTPRKRRRRGGRGRGGARKTTAPAEAEAEDAVAPKPTATKPADKPAQRRPRKTAAQKEATAAKAERTTGGGSTRIVARQQRRQQRPTHRRQHLSEEEAKALRGEAKTMLIHLSHGRTQIAVIEERMLIQHFVAREDTKRIVGNIYLGRVQNVIAGMEAAFVDLGHGRNAVLYAGEVNYSAEDLEGDAPPRIEKVLKSGQPVLVQVTKDPIGTKGARLTSQISIPGRFLVLAPEQRLTGISRRLHEDERARLRQILRDIRPDGHGVIVRTAAEGATMEQLERDLQHLVKQWDEIKRAQKKSKAPALLEAEPELVMRVVRDMFSGDFEQVVTDSREIYDRVSTYVEEVAPEFIKKLVYYEGPLPMFEAFHVTEQIHKALERKIWLPSGGSIVIDKTEAMTVIDVNTGRFVGKGGSLEDTVYKNNLEAAEEIARQLRLRDIGGIIVIDFIDMLSMANRNEVIRTLKRTLARDKVRSQVSDEVSKLGLVEMTRKRSSEGLLEAFSETCPECEGRGIVITHEID